MYKINFCQLPGLGLSWSPPPSVHLHYSFATSIATPVR